MPVRPLLARFTSRLSLRARLLVLALALVTTGLVVSDTIVLGTVRVQLVEQIDQQLQRYGPALSHRPAGKLSPPDVPGRPAQGAGRRGQYLPSQYLVQYLSSDGKVQGVMRQPVSDTDPAPQLAGLDPAATAPDVPFDLPDQRGHRTWRVLVLPLQPQRSAPATAGAYASPQVTPTYLMVAVSREDIDATIRKLRTSFLAIGGAVFVLIAALGFFAVRTGLRPLRTIEAGAARIAAGELSHRMPGPSSRTEVGRLSIALNGMLTQIEAAFAARAESEARMRRFIADASHELRTPLAGIRGFTELYRMGALPTEEDVRRTMTRIESEAVRMGTLVEDLLVLARLDEERPLDLAPMDLRTLAADALHDLTALDPTRPVALTGPAGTGAPGAAPVLGDEARLRQVVTNLVGNAVKHTPPGTPVRIGVGGGPDGVCLLEVADSGPGLTEEQALQVFERFYRVDASRSRQDGGGAGLGLAIATALTHAHGGTLTLQTAPGSGATFRVELPTTQPA
ncbi:HAMP domain-containing sensor histidine kinase [Streptomyces sp. SP17BM10]|uniref:sensor histidine kinase n=1 Tax=Streptomyces sp. SP17BM10 TaxID=3002530 RepID=UPI002E75A71C|nr:HAMP domain-containing sensor histidine kinase [Streptomyces sp. SP17BM10]MEE1785748.1 HAMP domain-containing sensor histidine kinase [Streptomyces sp. SP17BM10]